jgi:hypothetical protein
MISEMSVDCIIIYANYMIDECKSFRRIVRYDMYDECPICYEVMSKPVKTVCNHHYCESCYSKIDFCSMCRSDLKKPKDDKLERVLKALKDFIVFSDDEPVNECVVVLMNIARLLLLHPEFDINDIEGSYNRMYGILNADDY